LPGCGDLLEDDARPANALGPRDVIFCRHPISLRIRS
jgi:hypothetical protein